MLFSDGFGTYLRIWSDGKWLYVGASLRLQTLFIGWLVYLIAGWGVYRWKRARKQAAEALLLEHGRIK